MADKVTKKSLQLEVFELVEKYSSQKDLKLTNSTSIDGIGINSLDLLEIVFRLEESHGMAISDLDVGGVKTLGEIIDIAHDAIKA